MEEIITLVAPYIPAVCAVIINVVVWILSNKTLTKILTVSTTSIKTIEEKAHHKELKLQLKLAVEENKKLREELDTLICAINHVYKPEGKHVCEICNKEI